MREWERRLDAARTEWDVVVLAKDFVASLDYVDIMGLPLSCRPGKLLTANDVTSYAFDLVQHRCVPDDASEAVLLRMAAFFARASNRLARILGPASEDDPALQVGLDP